MKLRQTFLLLTLITTTLTQLLITSISLSNDAISQLADYNFQIVRYGILTPIPAASVLQISFPNAYSTTSLGSCATAGWDGASTLNCAYSQLKLNVTGGFPVATNIQNFGFIASGIRNPSAAKAYTWFYVRLIYPNGTAQTGTGGYSVTITTANATCSMTLNSGLVFSQGQLTISYISQYISSSSTGYTMKLSMLQSYPSDASNTDVNPVLSISNTMLATYLFEFPFTNTFNINMLMPPSTQPQVNFIFIMTSNVLGDYDKCFITISGVQPNQFALLNFGIAEVQSLGNLNVGLKAETPILTSDMIRINFTNSQFNVTQSQNLATFTKGVIGQKQVTKSGQVLTIRNIAAFVIVQEIGFYLSNIGFPFSTKPQQITIFIETEAGYLRNSYSYQYTSQPGTLNGLTYTCLTSQIGYTTSCTVNLTLKNKIKDTSYIQIKYPTGFKIVNGFAQCTISGVGLNSVASCNSYAITNSVRVSGFIGGTGVDAGVQISVVLAAVALPNKPDGYSISVSTKTQDGYTIDSASVLFTAQPRALLSGQILITSSSSITNSPTVYSITLNLPLNLAITYVFNLYIPFPTSSTPSVNNNLLASTYITSNSTLQIQSVTSSIMTISGFLTHQSTAPITLSGNITFNNLIYFYFRGFDIAMTLPKEVSTFSLQQSNSIVGSTFLADVVISQLKVADVVRFPAAVYAINQTACSTNCLCGPNGDVVVNAINNFGTGLTKISVNLINVGYISTNTFNVTILSSGGVFIKQTKQTSIRTQVPNILNITVNQSNPYYLQVSVYTFNVSMTTPSPASSLNNFLQVSVPNQYTIQDWSCIFGCVAPSPPATGNRIYFTISSTRVSFTIKLLNPISFLSQIQMTSTSLGDMDHGTYLPSVPCASPCRSCSTNTSECLTCYLWSSQNKLRAGTCVGDCQLGQFYNSTSFSCQSCHSYCLSCVNTSTTCYTCKPAYFYFQLACLVACPQTYYPTNTGQCGSCSTDCLICTSATNCSLCGNGSYLYQGACWASCQQGTFINPLAFQCLNCSSNCTTCDATGCSRCQNNFYLYNKLCYQACPSGLFKSTQTCQPCQQPCQTCQTFSNNCTSCTDLINSTSYYYLNNQCYQNACPNTYYISPIDNICLQCQSPCLNCNRSSCLTCRTGYYYYGGFCVLECGVGTWANSTALICVNCDAKCASCSSATLCLSCISPYFLYNSTCISTCPLGYYSQPLLCTPCPNPCLTCTSTTCSSCSTLSYFNGTCYSTCPSGYYSTISSVLVLNQTVKQCISCISPCITCISNTSCMSCRNGLKLYNYGCFSTCPEFYYDLNGICYACSLPCKTCNSTGCLTCASTTQYLQRQECMDACTDFHPNNLTMICQACKSPCSTCTWSTTCLSCVDPYIFYLGQCIRTCPAGMYNSNQICLTCPSLCSTCYLQSDQIRCPTCKQGNYFYGYSCVATCPNQTTLQPPYCLSPSCASLTDCTTCSNLRCLSCETNFTLSSANKCEAVQVDSTVIAAISQIPVPFPFLIATVIIIVCGFLIRIEFNKMFTPLFIYSFVGVAQAGLFALWLALIYTRGINQNMDGLVLKIAATVVVGVYVLFNFLSFIFYIKITRNDRKFRTWEKQDNRCASIVMTIVSLLLTFRFSILKFSKLGHLLKFSATLSHDSKLSHQNLSAFLSIAIISIPAMVISAWIAYLQTKMNYLFFTSLQVAVLAVIMIILSIIQSLSPKGYTLEKRDQFKQGHDSDGIDGNSLSEMMVKMGVVEEEYNEGKEIVSEEDNVGNRNIMDQEYGYHVNGMKTTGQLVNTKAQDQKLSFQSDINQSQNTEARDYQNNLQARDEVSELQNILMEAEQRTRDLSLPIRQFGSIRKQTFRSLGNQNEESQQIQSDDEPPPIDTINKTGRKRQGSLLRREEELDLKDLKNTLDIQERRMGMKRLEQLFDRLKMQQKQQKELRQRLNKVTEEEKILKQKQFERARQLLERNQMSIEDKMSKVQQLLQGRSKNVMERKQKIEQMERKRKQQRSQRLAQQSMRKNLVFPIQQQQNESVLTKKQAQFEANFGGPSNGAKEYQKSEQIQWDQSQKKLDFNKNADWKITNERQSPGLKGKLEQRIIKNQNKIEGPLISQPFEQVEIDHWPIDPELQQKINEVQQRADRYIRQPKKKKKKTIVEQFDIDLQSDTGTGADEFIYEEANKDLKDQSSQQEQQDNQHKLEVNSNVKVPKSRYNRNVINLSPY